MMTIDYDALLARIDAKRDELVALTQELVRIPTINPPGDAYEACARVLGERLDLLTRDDADNVITARFAS